MTQRGGIPRENGNRMEKTYTSTDTERTGQHKGKGQGNNSRGGAILLVAIIALLVIGAGVESLAECYGDYWGAWVNAASFSAAY